MGLQDLRSERTAPEGHFQQLQPFGGGRVRLRRGPLQLEDQDNADKERDSRKRICDALPKVRSFTWHLPVLRVLCERAESVRRRGRGPRLLWPGLCRSTAGLCLRVLRLLSVYVRAVWFLRP